MQITYERREMPDGLGLAWVGVTTINGLEYEAATLDQDEARAKAEIEAALNKQVGDLGGDKKRMRYVSRVPGHAGKIVDILMWDKRLIVACEHQIYEVVGMELIPLRFRVGVE